MKAKVKMKMAREVSVGQTRLLSGCDDARFRAVVRGIRLKVGQRAPTSASSESFLEVRKPEFPVLVVEAARAEQSSLSKFDF